MDVRRVVTGHDASGKSVFVSDGPFSRVARFTAAPGRAIGAVWATDLGMTTVPGSDDPTGRMITFVPGPGGTRMVVVVLPPAAALAAGEIDRELLERERREQLPGLAEATEDVATGMHTTDTVDYDIVVSGELWLELDDGAEVHLRPGDIVVQNGTRHAWRNKGAVPCVFYGILVGAPRRS